MIRWINSKTVVGKTVSGSQTYTAEIQDDGMYIIRDYFGKILECSKFLGNKELGVRVQDFLDIHRTPKELIAKEARDKIAKDNAVEIVTDVIPNVLSEEVVDASEFSHEVDVVIDDVVPCEELSKEELNALNINSLIVAVVDGKIIMSDIRADKIKYTLDGKDITNFAKVYKDPIDYVEGMIIKAKSYLDKKEIGSYGC